MGWEWDDALVEHPGVQMFIEDHEPLQQERMEWLRQRVRALVPEFREHIKWQVPFFYGQGPICYYSPSKRRLRIGFVRGAEFHEEAPFLDGGGRSPIRVLDAKWSKPWPEEAIERALELAIRVDHERPFKVDEEDVA